MNSIDNGYDINHTNRYGYSLLHVAAYDVHNNNGNIRAVCYLLKMGASTEVYNCYGFSPLYMASMGNDSNIVSLLINNQARVNGENPYNSQTPIYAAISYCRPENVKILIDSRAELNIEDKYGRTPVFIAAKKSKDILYELLKNGAVPNQLSSEGGIPVFAAIGQCVEDGDQDAAIEKIKLLVEYGADMEIHCSVTGSRDSRLGCINRNNLQIQNQETPYQYAHRLKYYRISKYIQSVTAHNNAAQ